MKRPFESDLSPANVSRSLFHPTYILLAASFLVSIAMAQIGLSLVFYAQDMFQATPGQIGWLSGTFMLTYGLSCLAIQFHLHRFRPGKLIVAATVLLGACYTGMPLVTTLKGLFWLVGLAGIALSCFWAPLMAWLSIGLEGAALNRRISWFNVSWSMGAIVGPLTCGYLSEQSVRLPILVSAGLMFLVTGLITIRMFQDGAEGRTASAAPAPVETPAPVSNALYRYPAWIGLLAAFFCLSVAATILPIVARAQLLFAESTIGILLFMRALFNTLTFLTLGRATFWHFRGWPMLGGQLLIALLMLGLVFAQTPVSIGCMLAGLGIAGGLAYTASIFHGISGSYRRGGRMAIHESLIALGCVSGCVIGGVVCQAYSISRVYWICAGISLATLAIQAALLRWIRKSASLPRQ